MGRQQRRHRGTAEYSGGIAARQPFRNSRRISEDGYGQHDEWHGPHAPAPIACRRKRPSLPPRPQPLPSAAILSAAAESTQLRRREDMRGSFSGKGFPRFRMTQVRRGGLFSRPFPKPQLVSVALREDGCKGRLWLAATAGSLPVWVHRRQSAPKHGLAPRSRTPV